MAVQVASLFGVLSLDDTQFRSGISGAMTGLDQLGSRLTTVGSGITTLFAPAAAAFGVATGMAVSFDEQMTNIQAVTGRSAQEMATLRDEVMRLGSSSRFGPQAAAQAMYDIVGGVGDASVQMAIFETAISTAQAGNADLGATTRALISIMNSYKLGADEAGTASDILTRTVGMGVGTMDEFAGALPTVTGLAHSLGIGFNDLAGWTAYLTTQGNTASQSTTQLGAMMSAIMKPNADMSNGLKELGFESGAAAIEQLGLVGTMQALAGTQTAGTQGFAAMLGTQEALRGSTALMSQDVAGFMLTFTGGLEGATAAAEAVQMTSAAAQVDLLKSSISELGIEVGTAMIPALRDLVAAVMPVISNVIKWVKENPELIRQIGTIVTIAAGAGVAITGAGTAISAVSNIVKLATTPWGALLTAITLVIAAYQEFQRFTGTVQAGQQAVVSQHGAAFASGAISQTDYEAVAFKAAQAQFGDLGARLMWDNPSMRQIFMMPYLQGAAGIPARDMGGPGMAGGAYMIGTGAQPELFVPSTSGTFIPNADRLGGDTITVNVYANDRAGGEAAADAFERRLKEIWQRRGNG